MLVKLATMVSDKLNYVIEKIVGLLMIVLLLDVWVGVLDRYVFEWEIAWVEEVARYLMIWATLLAVSCGVSKREHIGLFIILNKIPPNIRIYVLSFFDLVTMLFFLTIFYLGLDFANSGLSSYIDSIFGVSMFIPYLAIPTFGLVCAIQVLCVSIRDFDNANIYDLDYR